jgi:hypothetical protein
MYPVGTATIIERTAVIQQVCIVNQIDALIDLLLSASLIFSKEV